MIDPTRGARDERTRELISTFRSADSEFERAKALEDVTRLHLPLARSLAHRYSGKGIERDDLEQVAFLALLKAVHRFDLAQTTEFGAYATPTITGELRRHFRDHGWLVRPPPVRPRDGNTTGVVGAETVIYAFQDPPPPRSRHPQLRADRLRAATDSPLSPARDCD